MRPGRTLLVFLKYPEPGRVKTRLAETIGPEKAAALYRLWIGAVLVQLQPLRSTTRLVGYFDGAPHDAFGDWHQLADDWWPQPSGDLGDRLRAGVAAGFADGGPVVAIGTDCLEIEPDLVAQAFEELAHADVVFGPTPDGGYYLVGMAALRPSLFQSVRWSSPFTLADHLHRCQQEGWSVCSLPMRHDIDTWQDWQAYLQRSGRAPDGAIPDPGRRHSDPR
jgi:rSAM/selenodomain-associated transferase 1